jgi:hypothetical protein
MQQMELNGCSEYLIGNLSAVGVLVALRINGLYSQPAGIGVGITVILLI